MLLFLFIWFSFPFSLTFLPLTSPQPLLKYRDSNYEKLLSVIVKNLRSL